MCALQAEGDEGASKPPDPPPVPPEEPPEPPGTPPTRAAPPAAGQHGALEGAGFQSPENGVAEPAEAAADGASAPEMDHPDGCAWPE